jgi:hypothetical protein
MVDVSAASNHKKHPGIARGDNPPDKAFDVAETTSAIALYKRRIVFDVDPEIARVTAFDEGMVRGLVRESVFVNVILRKVLVALRSVQKRPPSDVAVEAGSVTALNPEFVR